MNIISQVHLVPINRYPTGNILAIDKYGTLIRSAGERDSSRRVGHHIYFTSDEPYRDGDWITDGKLVWEYVWWNSERITSNEYKRIIATTDEALCKATKLNTPMVNHLTGITSVGIAGISKDFIGLYLQRYNDGNPIKEVELETRCNTHHEFYANKEQWTNYIKLDSQGCVIVSSEQKTNKDKAWDMLWSFRNSGDMNLSHDELRSWFNKNYQE